MFSTYRVSAPTRALRAHWSRSAFQSKKTILLTTGWPVAVKLNSADFQKGGFAFEDALTLSKWLEDEGVDLIEVSGGMYEQPKMMGFDGKTL